MSLIIGIGGGSGSGKTTLADYLEKVYKDRISIIQYDNYCNDQSKLTMEERVKVNYDIPSSYDGDLLLEHIQKLKQNLPIDRPIYDMSTHSRVKNTIKILPNEIIIIEGIMFFPLEKVFSSLDLKIFVSCNEERRFKRRLKRDVEERGRNKESVIKQFNESVKPMHDIYVEPFKEKVDFIFDNDNDDGLNKDEITRLINMIDSKINNHKI